MDNNYFLKLCSAVYRITELFPKSEPLKFQIREMANKILADLIYSSPNYFARKQTLLKNIEILKYYFNISEAQNWVNSRNFLILSKEYDTIKQFLNKQKIDKQSKEKPSNTFNSLTNLSFRQKEIMKILNKEKRLRLVEIQKFFPKINKRTIRRDLSSLFSQKLISRYDKGKMRFYKLK
ncbi:MAG: DeoR family transcriptional regulator [Patescibacteria group bacterium]|nr:DeoR family transcriptional regulator [Patescibacteria group bacterium]